MSKKSNAKNILIQGTLLVCLLAIPSSVSAQLSSGFAQAIIPNPGTGAAAAFPFRQTIINTATVIASLLSALALVAVVYGGILYVTALGDESKARRGKLIVLYALAGIVIASLAALLVNIAVFIVP